MNGLKKLLVSGVFAAGILMTPGMAMAAGNGYVDYNAVIAATPAFQSGPEGNGHYPADTAAAVQ